MATVLIHAVDSQGVHLVSGGSSFSAALVPPRAPVTIVDNKDGSYTASFTTTVSGTYLLSVVHGTHCVAGRYVYT